MLKPIYFTLMFLTGCIGGNTSNAETTKANAKEQFVPSSTQAVESLEVISQNPSLISMGIDEVVTHQELVISVISINDSRCPIGEACIWAGKMEVILEVLNMNGDKAELKLEHNRKPEAGKAMGYSFQLMDIQPHPRKDKKMVVSKQSIDLKVTKN